MDAAGGEANELKKVVAVRQWRSGDGPLLAQQQETRDEDSGRWRIDGGNPRMKRAL
jgi:hypothetical protein